MQEERSTHNILNAFQYNTHLTAHISLISVVPKKYMRHFYSLPCAVFLMTAVCCPLWYC